MIKNKHLIPALFGFAAGAILFLATSKYGIGVSPDSACYLSIADNVAGGNGYAIYDFEPAVAWPPFYPTVLAAGKYIGIDTAVFARAINILLIILLVYLTAGWIFSNIEWGFLRWFGAIGMLFSPLLLYISKYAWSELPFALLVILALFQIERYRNSSTIKNMMFLAIVTALACLTRYIGVTLVLFAVIWIFKSNQKHKPIQIITFLSISVLPLALWLWRNLAVSSTLSGPRTESTFSLWTNILFTVDSLSSWLVPQDLSPAVRGPVAVIIVLAAAYFFWKSKSPKSPKTNFLQVFMGYGVFYILCLIVMATLAALGRIDWRFMSPAYLPLFITALIAIDSIISRSNTRFTKHIFVTLLSIWVLYGGYYSIIEIKSSIESGAGGYSTDLWQKSEIANFLKSNPLEDKLYSNFPDGIYTLTGKRATISPRKSYFSSNTTPPDEFETVNSLLNTDSSAYLVWFTDLNREIVYTPEELGRKFQLSVYQKFSDGIIYKLTLKPPGV